MDVGTSFQEGQKIGRFELLRPLGSGAVGEVWLANQVGAGDFRRKVAIKVLKSNAFDEDAREALHQEARLCARLDHPNIVKVTEFEEIEDRFIMVMQYVAGGTLSSLVRRVTKSGLRFPKSVIISFARDMAAALAYAHGGGTDGELNGPVIHRDLKPANILVSGACTALVADFGIAKVTGEVTSTATGAFKGTPAYTAPEIWAGRRDFLPAADLFSLGCVVYELVTLKRLFGGGSIASIFGQVSQGDANNDVAPVRGLFPELAPLLEYLLERKPENRCTDARIVLDFLAELRAEMPPSPEAAVFMRLLDLRDATPEQREERSSGFRLPATMSGEWEALAVAAREGRALEDAAPLPAGSGPIFLDAGGTSGAAAAGFLAKTRTLGGMPIVSAQPSSAEPQEQGADSVAPADPTEGTQSLQLQNRDELQSGAKAEARSTSVWLAVLIAVLAVGGLVVGSLAVLFNETAPEGASLSEEPTVREVAVSSEVFVPPGTSTAQSAESAPEDDASAEGAKPVAGGNSEAATTAADTASRESQLSRGDPKPASSAPGSSSTGLVKDSNRTAVAAQEPAKLATPAPPSSKRPPPVTQVAEPAPEPKAKEVAAAPAVSASQKQPSAPAAEATEAAPAPAAEPCLVLVSHPIGAKVWINGRKNRRRALSASASGFRRPAGTIQVGMGSGDAPEASTQVELAAGASVLVECDLQVAGTCSSRAIPSGRCAN